jgi:hypothetical protein
LWIGKLAMKRSGFNKPLFYGTRFSESPVVETPLPAISNMKNSASLVSVRFACFARSSEVLRKGHS